MHGGDDVGLSVDAETDVAVERLIQNGVYGLALVVAALPAAAQPGAIRRGDQIPDCQVLGMPALPIADSIARQASRASG